MLFKHVPDDYICPFCLVVKGEEDDENKLVQTKQEDIIYKDDYVTALVATLWWPNNKGHVIIIPKKISLICRYNMLLEYINYPSKSLMR
jgi:histidine triad (HIT) family protein